MAYKNGFTLFNQIILSWTKYTKNTQNIQRFSLYNDFLYTKIFSIKIGLLSDVFNYFVWALRIKNL